jgi:hypothetical protein
MGKSFVEEETRSAVLTEFGRAYAGRKPRSRRGDQGEEVRKRMETWKARVDTEQRITRKVSGWIGCT